METDEEGTAQAVRVDTIEGRAIPGEYEGLATPLHYVEKYLLKIQKRGLDKSW